MSFDQFKDHPFVSGYAPIHELEERDLKREEEMAEIREKSDRHEEYF
jgi:hypothetical protein